MRLLLDTHVAVWATSERSRLPVQARGLLLDPDNSVFVSVVSLWEIAIKYGLNRHGPGRLRVSAREALTDFQEANFELLPVSASHAVSVDGLPPMHGDPFDRLIVAQALSEPLRLVTHDTVLARYMDNLIVI